MALLHSQSAILPFEKCHFVTGKCHLTYARVSHGENEWRVRRNGRTLHVNRVCINPFMNGSNLFLDGSNFFMNGSNLFKE